MWKSHLTIAFRNLRRHRSYALINLAGLAAGLACVVLIGLFVRDELAYDRFHAHLDRLYRLTSQVQSVGDGAYGGLNGTVGWPVGDRVREEFPEVEAVVNARFWSPPIMLDGAYQYEDVLYVEDGFLEAFSFPLAAGDPATALDEPYSLVLTEEMARKYFGRTDVVGRTLMVRDTLAFTVTGVARDLPAQSSLQFDMLASFATFRAFTRDDEQWGSGWFNLNMTTFVLLREGADAAAFETKLAGLPMRHAGAELEAMGFRMRLGLLPFRDHYLRNAAWNGFGPMGDARRLFLLAAIGGFVLLIACINFVNLATARSVERAKEVGVRKVVGSSRGALVRQFLTEAALLTVFALVVALALAVAALPLFNGLTGKAFGAADVLDVRLVPALAGLAAVVALLAGLYPALVLSGLQPAATLKGAFRTSARGVRLRQGLVVTQFALTVALVAATLVVVQQIRFMQAQPLGFDREHVVVFDASTSPWDARHDQAEAIKAALEAAPGVLQTTALFTAPGNSGWQGQVVWPEGFSREEATDVEYLPVDADYVETLGLELVAGRDFAAEVASDSSALILNEAAARAFGWTPETALGKFIDSPSGAPRGTVIGVVRDFHQRGLREPVSRIVLGLTEAYQAFAVRLGPTADVPRTLAHAEAVWARFFPGYPLDYTFLDEAFDRQYQSEVQQAKAVGTFAGLAIVIACLGLFGLAAFTTVQRTKEIGVRKVLGASAASIVGLLSRDFLALVLVALVLATPAAYWAMSRWLEGYAYRVDLGPGVFVLAGALALAVALLTVAGHALRAATTDPVKALRYE